MAAHHRLDGLGQDLPGRIQIGGKPSPINFQLAQAFKGRIEGKQAVAQGNPKVSQHGGVGQVPLKTRYRKLFAQMAKQGIRNPKIALSIFKVDRVDFMRHGG